MLLHANLAVMKVYWLLDRYIDSAADNSLFKS